MNDLLEVRQAAHGGIEGLQIVYDSFVADRRVDRGVEASQCGQHHGAHHRHERRHQRRAHAIRHRGEARRRVGGLGHAIKYHRDAVRVAQNDDGDEEGEERRKHGQGTNLALILRKESLPFAATSDATEIKATEEDDVKNCSENDQESADKADDRIQSNALIISKKTVS